MNQYKTVAFYTLGCKLNFSETSTIARNLIDAGYARVDFDASADVYVINTCSVTDNADKKCKTIVSKVKKSNPNAFVIIIGCFAQLKPEEISKMPGVNLVLGANEKFNVAEHLEQLDIEDEAQFISGKIGRVKEFHPSYSHGDRTRTFLKIQDGCDYYCTFCTIPLARGRSRSNTIAETMKSAKEVEALNVQEVVITGVNTGEFGVGTDENFHQLIQEFDQLDIPRWRISSIEPNLLTNEIIEFVSQSNHFAHHFHVPLQSGSNKILNLMKRKYEKDLYADRVATIKRLMPNACIGVDVIVGFPGETDEDFQETYDFLKDLDVSYFHVFTYSERNNTQAVKMEDVVPMKVRNERSKMLRILSAKKKRAFYESQVGKSSTVLWEAKKEEDQMHGFTNNYIKITAPYDAEKVNTLQEVYMDEIDRTGTMAVKELEQA